jgi:hypothetical protein
LDEQLLRRCFEINENEDAKRRFLLRSKCSIPRQ